MNFMLEHKLPNLYNRGKVENGKQANKMKRALSDLCDHDQRSTVCVTRVPGKEKCSAEKYSKKYWPKISPTGKIHKPTD